MNVAAQRAVMCNKVRNAAHRIVAVHRDRGYSTVAADTRLQCIHPATLSAATSSQVPLVPPALRTCAFTTTRCCPTQPPPLLPSCPEALSWPPVCFQPLCMSTASSARARHRIHRLMEHMTPSTPPALSSVPRSASSSSFSPLLSPDSTSPSHRLHCAHRRCVLLPHRSHRHPAVASTTAL